MTVASLLACPCSSFEGDAGSASMRSLKRVDFKPLSHHCSHAFPHWAIPGSKDSQLATLSDLIPFRLLRLHYAAYLSWPTILLTPYQRHAPDNPPFHARSQTPPLSFSRVTQRSIASSTTTFAHFASILIEFPVVSSIATTTAALSLNHIVSHFADIVHTITRS